MSPLERWLEAKYYDIFNDIYSSILLYVIVITNLFVTKILTKLVTKHRIPLADMSVIGYYKLSNFMTITRPILA